jgi:hypothetical protein
MEISDLQRDRHTQDMVQFLDLAERAITSESIEHFMAFALPWIASFGEAPAVFVYLAPKRVPLPSLHHRGLASGEIPLVEAICRAELDRSSPDQETPSPLHGAVSPSRVSDYWLWPLLEQRGPLGIFGIVPSSQAYHLSSAVWESLVKFLAHTIDSFHHRAKTSRQVAYLNTYLTVSTLLAQSLGLHDLLETILFFCTDVVSAEEASVLLLDDSRENFTFFQTEGASRSVLSGISFPAEKGIAGAVLSNRKSEIVNDVQNDPRFYRRFDTESGVSTRNLIAIPLVAGSEPVGILEVINKGGGLPFSDDDHLLLHFIADEIAFAVRNARIFEYVVNSYCKQRQGLNTCAGCERPLGSWTPCVKYRANTPL